MSMLNFRSKNKCIPLAFNVLFFLTTSFLFESCKKFVEVDPPDNRISGENVFENDATAISAITSLYINLSKTTTTEVNFGSLSFLAALSADELTLWNQSTIDLKLEVYYKNGLYSLSTNDIFGSEFWNVGYSSLFQCNSAIEQISAASNLTPSIKTQLMGEAKFMRAFIYFYLVNLYGDVPLVLTTDYKVNSTLPRSPMASVYNQIIRDLQEAVDVLNVEYLDHTLLQNTQERIRPTKWAAHALLARTYLYLGQWADSEDHATMLINNPIFKLAQLNETFLKSSSGNPEAVWQLQPVNPGWNTELAKLFVLSASGPSQMNPVFLSQSQVQSFETGDVRAIPGNWIDSVVVGGDSYYFPFKYKSILENADIEEYLTVIRLAEIYLIRSEARSQQDNISGSQDDLNTVRRRAGLPDTDANDKFKLNTAILKERRAELFTEWGHRWLDLKRTMQVDAVMDSVAPGKGIVWQSYKQYYPLPYRDLQANKRLTQNDGY